MFSVGLYLTKSTVHELVVDTSRGEQLDIYVRLREPLYVKHLHRTTLVGWFECLGVFGCDCSRFPVASQFHLHLPI